MEAAEEHLEEELEEREDQEEEQAIAAERAARAASDAVEEAAEEAQEARELASRTPVVLGLVDATSRLRLRVRVSAHRSHSNLRPGRTRLAVSTSAPAQIRIVLRTEGRPAKRFSADDVKGRSRYVIRVPWNCNAPSLKYTFVVTAYSAIKGQSGARDAIARRGTFSVPGSACADSRR